MTALWSYDLVFVVVDGVQVAPGTVMRWAVVHVAIPLVAVLVPLAAWMVRRRRPTAADLDEAWRPSA